MVPAVGQQQGDRRVPVPGLPRLRGQVRDAVLVEPEAEQVIPHPIVAGDQDLVLLEAAPEPGQELGVSALLEMQGLEDLLAEVGHGLLVEPAPVAAAVDDAAQKCPAPARQP